MTNKEAFDKANQAHDDLGDLLDTIDRVPALESLCKHLRAIYNSQLDHFISNCGIGMKDD